MTYRAKGRQAGARGRRAAAPPPADPPPDILRALVTLYQQARHADLLAAATRQQRQHPRSYALHSLIAGAHAGLGNPDAAITSLDQALALWPDSAELHYNKGVLLAGTGAQDAARRCYETALKLDPSHAGAANNLGSVLRAKGDFIAALRAYRHAVALQPRSAAAHNNLAVAHQHLGQASEALVCFMTALRLAPTHADIRRNVINLLTGPLPVGLAPGLPELLHDLLLRDHDVRPSELAPAICRLCLADPILERAASALGNGPDVGAALDALAGVPLLTATMALCPIPDPDIERLLSRLRAAFCLHPEPLTEPAPRVAVLTALAAQCFINDYIYTVTPEERQALDARTGRVQDHLARGAAPEMTDLLCLASYLPLGQTAFAARLAADHLPEPIWRMQIAEPEQEANLRGRIPAFGQIANKVSEKVRSQYEANPYPRWIRPGSGQSRMTLAQMIDQLGLHLRNPAPRTLTAPQILVAGCGTGQQSIEISRRLAGAQVTAIDLSRASLAYAGRKTRELGIANVDYLHGDILDLDALGRPFDIVFSTGVLHHMEDPEAGWRALCRRLPFCPAGTLWARVASGRRRCSSRTRRACRC